MVLFFSSKVYLYTSNDPIIEASRGLQFGPYNIGYPGLQQHAESAKLNLTENKWELVFDFSSLTGDKSEKFVQMPPEEWATELLTIPGVEDSTNQPQLYFDFPKRYGGTASDEPPASSAAAETNAFNITNTTADQAQNLFEQ